MSIQDTMTFDKDMCVLRGVCECDDKDYSLIGVQDETNIFVCTKFCYVCPKFFF